MDGHVGSSVRQITFVKMFFADRGRTESTGPGRCRSRKRNAQRPTSSAMAFRHERSVLAGDARRRVRENILLGSWGGWLRRAGFTGLKGPLGAAGNGVRRSHRISFCSIVRAGRGTSQSGSFTSELKLWARAVFDVAQFALLACDVVPRHRHDPLAFGELDLEDHHVLLEE